MENILPAVAGWIGMVLILIAYYLVSTRRVTGDSYMYQTLNLLGAIGLVSNTLVQQAWPAMVLNIVWVVIAIYAIFTARKKKA